MDGLFAAEESVEVKQLVIQMKVLLDKYSGTWGQERNVCTREFRHLQKRLEVLDPKNRMVRVDPH